MSIIGVEGKQEKLVIVSEREFRHDFYVLQ